MSPENFTYWLRGYFELTNSNCLMPEQIKIINDHLDLVFTKVTPDITKPTFSELFKETVKYPSLPKNINVTGSTRYC